MCPWQFPAKPSVVLGSREQQTSPAPHPGLGAHMLKAKADGGRAHSPSILDIFFSSALLAELLAGVFPCLTDNRSWWAKPFYLQWWLIIHFEEVLEALPGHLMQDIGNECSYRAGAMLSTSYSLSECLLSDSHWTVFHKSQTVFHASLPSRCYGKMSFNFFLRTLKKFAFYFFFFFFYWWLRWLQVKQELCNYTNLF